MHASGKRLYASLIVKRFTIIHFCLYVIFSLSFSLPFSCSSFMSFLMLISRTCMDIIFCYITYPYPLSLHFVMIVVLSLCSNQTIKLRNIIYEIRNNRQNETKRKRNHLISFFLFLF